MRPRRDGESQYDNAGHMAAEITRGVSRPEGAVIIRSDSRYLVVVAMIFKDIFLVNFH